jgi:hypothetical protein
MAHPDRNTYDQPFDDDMMFDAIDDQDERQGRPLLILLGLIVIAAFAAVIWVAYSQGLRHAGAGAPPILAQDPGPTRVAPDQTGGVAAPAQDKLIYEKLEPDARSADAQGVLMPPAEEPKPIPSAQDVVPGSQAAAPDESQDGYAPSDEVSSAPLSQPNEPTPDMTVSSLRPEPAQRAAGPSGQDITSALPPAQTAPTAITPTQVDPLPAAAKPVFTGTATDGTFLNGGKRNRNQPERIAMPAAAPATADTAASVPAETVIAEPSAPPIIEKPKPIKPRTPPKPVVTAAAPAATGTESAAAVNALDEPFMATPASKPLQPPLATPPGTIAFGSPAAAPASPPAASQSTAAISQPTESEMAAIAPAAEPAPAPPAAAATESAASIGGKAFVVQIGSFTSAEDAAASWSRVKTNNGGILGDAQPEIRQVDLGAKGTRFRLRAGNYGDRSAAQSVCSKLKATGQDCVVTAR